MAIDLSAVTKAPWPRSATGLGTTWTKISIPSWAWLRFNATGQVYVAYAEAGDPSSPEAPSDGGSVGTHRSLVGASGAATGWVIADWPDLPAKQTAPGAPRSQARDYYIAAVSSTVDVDLEVIHPSQVI